MAMGKTFKIGDNCCVLNKTMLTLGKNLLMCNPNNIYVSDDVFYNVKHCDR